MQSQYLILAENITYKNNKLTCINIIDHFLTVKLPAELNFDLVAICGPGWEPAEYSVSIKVQLDDDEVYELGKTIINIPNIDFVYNAFAPNLKVTVKDNSKYIKFFVYRNEVLVNHRNYRISPLLVPQEIGAQKA
jgi:hypothetical protein